MIVFLILNYKNMDDTVKCIRSIEDLSIKNVAIVVVDNGSGDGSVEKMYNLYEGNDHIHIIESKENLGFSKGNNLGYAYIKERLNPDFVVVTNNDVLFPQKNLEELIINRYEFSHFYVLGPDIYVRLNKEHQSPIRLNLPTKSEIAKELDMYEYYLRHPEKWVVRRKAQIAKNRIVQSYPIFEKTYDWLRGKKNLNYSKTYENCCVQGACIIVSRNFLAAEPKMFTPEPFLYCEEIMLYKKCIDKGYKIIYDPAIQIWHEDSATMKKITSNSVDRARFTLRHHVKSRKMLLDLLD